MPEKIIADFEKQYGKKKGRRIYYATANKENRDPETFEKKNSEIENRGYLYRWLVANFRPGGN